MTEILKRKISELLKKYYPTTSPELKALRLNRHAKGIAEVTQDPLLWVRLIYGSEVLQQFALAQKVEKRQLRDTEDAVQERMNVLEKFCLDSQGKPDLASLGGKYSKLFGYSLDHEGSLVVRSSIDVDSSYGECSNRQVDSEHVLQGIVVDIYLTPPEQWVGYVCLQSKHAHGLANVFKFNCMTLAKPWYTRHSIHIGDTVEFSVASAHESNGIQNSTMRVVEYPPGISLDETFIQYYLSQIKQVSAESSLPALLLQSPAPWKSFLNEKGVYSKYYKEILAICFSFLRTDATELPIPPELMSIVGESAFIVEVPNLLKQDRRQNHDKASREYESYQRDVHAATNLLITFTKYSPNEAYMIADALKCLVRLSQEEIRSITLSVIETYLGIPNLPASQIPEVEPGVPTTQDPLFWVRLLYNESVKSSHLTAISASNKMPKKEVAKRQEVLEKYLPEYLEHLNVAEFEKLTQVEQVKAACLQTIDLKNRTEVDENSNPALQGVIVDIYPASQGNVDGYIACPAGDHYSQACTQTSCCVYKFDSSTPILTPNERYLLPLHIGDTITFKPAIESGNEVYTFLEVVEYYPPALSEDFAARYFSYINPTEGMEALLRVLESLAPWRGILNKPALYQKHYGNILTVYNACNSGDTVAIPDATKKLALTFKGCSFIQNIPQVLDKDVGKIERTDQYLRNVRIAANLLSSFVRHLGSEAKIVAEALKYMVEMLPTIALYPEFQSLTLSLIDSCLIPPASLMVSERPWKTIPTLLTKEEFEVSVQSTASPMKENPELPKVKASGRYNSIDEYGRTYFTLLRADCYGELIDTVARLKSQCRDERQDIFYHVTFIGLSQGFQNRSIVYAFRFEAHLPPEKSQDSILTQGNLMCFSIGGKFERDLVWGTVDRIADVCGVAIEESGKEVVLKEGKLYVQLWSEANGYPDEEVMVLLKQSGNIVAVESPAYFRAYYPVLEALKNLELEKVHFRDDLLDPGHEVKSKPEILSDNTKVDPMSVYKSSRAPGEMTVRQLKEALLDQDEHNSPLCLDLSQRDAIYNALSYPLTVIQGPPGTGKTFIAVKLLHLFLSLNTLPRGKPILVMAYKNRALDHFIDGCISQSSSGSFVCALQDIVRIGHMSDDYNHLQEALLSRKVKNAMNRSSRIEHVRKLHSLNERIQKASKNLDKRSKLTLQNCLCSITPEWLKSILLEAPREYIGKLNIPRVLKSKLQRDPKRILNLLKEEGIMGRQHSLEKKAVKTALCEAWKAWTADLNLQLEFQSSAKFTQRESSHQPSSEREDSVEDFKQLEQERLMATDDFDHQEGSLKDSLETNIIDLAVNEDMKIEDYHTHVWDLSPEQRKQLILSAVVGGYSSALDNMKESLRDYNKTLESYEWKKQAESLKILRKAKVVAMTTTGAAIHQQLLNKLEAPVLFVEEAAEVLESNLLACLTPHVKHLVLIGDHKQLKPKVACWKLGKYHSFNTSMFERLVNNNFPYTILMRQNRMHPTLVRLFDYHYAQQKKKAGPLLSSRKTWEYYHPPCMAQQFFWWSYTEHLEEKVGGAITNPYEVKMVIALCVWLLSQTAQCKITILTPYRAQLKKLQEGLRAKANQLTAQNLPIPVLIALATTIPVLTVDEFQGHESDVIILSLVRSNKRNLLGFLKEKNRLVVGTSREKCAFYIVGNAKFLEENSPVLWKDFIQRLRQEDIGDAVPVIRHGQTHNCTTPDELEKRAFLQTERQESTLDITESDSPVKYRPPAPHQPQRTSSESDEHSGRPELVTDIGDAIPAGIHCQETHSGAVPEATAYPFGTQRQGSVSNLINEPVRVRPPQSHPDTPRASSLDLGEEMQTGTTAVASRQQSSPAVLQTVDQHTEREKKFRRCCLALQQTEAVTEWKDIGRYLSVSDHTIDTIKQEEKQIKEQFYQMMREWWRQKGHATPEELIEALEFLNLQSVLEKVNKYINW